MLFLKTKRRVSNNIIAKEKLSAINILYIDVRAKNYRRLGALYYGKTPGFEVRNSHGFP